jgi:DUF1365 family protein
MSSSAIYHGTIAHQRRAVREHGFRYPITLAYLDLDALPAGLTRRRPGLVRFRRADYLGDPGVPLRDAVVALVRERTGTAPAGPVHLLAHLCVAGRCFNPVSFYYCHGADGTLEAIVAEVTNTPWGERHAYVLEARSGAGELAKRLRVSPFFGMDQRYTWRAGEPGEQIAVHIANHEDGRRVFDATLQLRRAPLSRRGLVRHALSALRVAPLIYVHAIALRLKGVRLHPHPVTDP